jgi:hypothetical protein
MTLRDKIITIYPSLTPADFAPISGTIVLQNDLDERGDYIRSWAHPTLPQPTAEQLA